MATPPGARVFNNRNPRLAQQRTTLAGLRDPASLTADQTSDLSYAGRLEAAAAAQERKIGAGKKKEQDEEQGPEWLDGLTKDWDNIKRLLEPSRRGGGVWQAEDPFSGVNMVVSDVMKKVETENPEDALSSLRDAMDELEGRLQASIPSKPDVPVPSRLDRATTTTGHVPLVKCC